MRKGIITIVTVLCLAIFAGCSEGKDKPGETTKTANAGKKEYQFVSEDFEQGNRPGTMGDAMLRTDKGFYHYSDALGGFRYYDAVTGKEMFLCNKPECRHDGNEFCVATNEKYTVLDYCLYGEHLMVFAAEVTETQVLYKVLVLALDGSSMDEVATVFSLEQAAGMSLYTSRMYLHRNKALLTFATGEANQQEDTIHRGAALLDLTTKNITFLDEEPLAKENVEMTHITAYGDYFYYCKKEGKKTVLHRYHMENGTDETCRLLLNFSGEYAVLEEDSVFYLRGEKGILCTYHFSTGENEEKVKTFVGMVPEFDIDRNLVGKREGELPADGLVTDGTYLYVLQTLSRAFIPDQEEEFTLTPCTSVRVFNKELEEVTVIEMTENLPMAEFEISDIGFFRTTYNCGFRYLGEDIYWCPVYLKDQIWEIYVYHCKRSDFLAGEPEFSFVYKYSKY